MPEITADPRRECRELQTLRDFLRYAVTLFQGAGLHHGHGATTPLDEAAFLILETLNLPVDDFNAFADARLTEREKAVLGDRLARRVDDRVPAAYLTGRTYLKGFSFRSDRRAIVPRSFIADLLLGPLFDGTGGEAALVADPESIGRVLELCTGGGSLAILAAHVFPNARIDAVELSPEAAALARENIADYGLQDRIRLLEGDLFAPVKGEVYDLILSNPPYVDAETMALLPREFLHEPTMALASGEDGLDITRRLLAEAPACLAKGAGLLCEVGLARPALEDAFPETPFLWLDTEDSEAEVFWLPRADFPR